MGSDEIRKPWDLKAYQARYRAENRDRLKVQRAAYYAENKALFKERAAKWRAENRDRISAKRAEYYAANSERLKAYSRKFRAEHLDNLRAYGAAYYIRNKDKFREYGKAYHAENRDRALARNRAYYAKNAENFRRYDRARIKNPERRAAAKEASWRHAGRGWTIERYRAALVEQAGACAICGWVPDTLALDADHNHLSGLSRGLLCSSCNLGIGHFREDVTLLRDAAPHYIQSSWVRAFGPREKILTPVERTRRDKRGWSPVAFKFAWGEQRGLCALCCGTPNKRGLFADHCHATGRLRALLCMHCNTGIGNFRDNPDLLRRAADYVEHWRDVHSAVPTTVTFTVDLETFDLIRPFL